MHAAHPPPPAPLNFPGSLPGKPTWILIMGEGEIKLLASAGVSLLRSFSNNDRDDNGKVKKKATGLSSKTTTITLFCSFLCHHCKTAVWKCLISHFTENVHLWQWILLSLSKPQCSPQEFNSKEICLHLSFSANRNKRDIKVKKMRIHFKSDILAAIIVVDAC